MIERGFTWSEQWRHECEVRFVLAMPTRAARAAYFDGMERWRTPGAIERLRRDVSDAWHAKRDGKPWPQLPESQGAAVRDAAVHLGVNAADALGRAGSGSFLGAPNAGDSDPDRGVVSGVAA